MKKRTKETGFMRFSKKLLISTFVVFVVGIVGLTSFESSLNIDCQKVEKEIASIESDIDGLNMKKQELASFTRISSIASKNGYTYEQGTATAAVIGVQRDL